MAKYLLARVTLILKKTLTTTNNALALPKKEVTRQERDMLMTILEVLFTVSVVFRQP